MDGKTKKVIQDLVKDLQRYVMNEPGVEDKHRYNICRNLERIKDLMESRH